jgi:putative spermidine/putrescine transport system permease protein
MSSRKRTWEAVSFEAVMTVVALIALAVIIAPSLVVLIVSFTSGYSLKFPPPGYSARWYVELWNAWQLHFAARNSFIVAMWSTACQSCWRCRRAACPLAYAYNARTGSTDHVAARASAPGFGLSALMLFSLVGLPVSSLTLVIGHTVVCVLCGATRWRLLSEPTLLESSAVLGASRTYTFRRIVLPLIRPGVIVGAFIAFMSSFDVPSPVFARRGHRMLPIRMWQDLEGKPM